MTQENLAIQVRALGLMAKGHPGKPWLGEFIVERHPVVVAVKAVDGNDIYKPGWSSAVVQVMLRVELAVMDRLGFEKDRALDLWLGMQEHALGALVVRWMGMDPPFPEHRLAMQRNAPEDPWCAHITTSKDGRFRDSKWLVVRS